MDKRSILIFKILAKSDDYISADDLCRELSIAPRTLREDMKRYREECENESGAMIQSKNSRGYKLVITDEEKYYSFLRKMLQEEMNNQFIMPVDPEDRINFIVRTFLKNKNYIKSEDLADEIFISRSTLSADLKKVKERLALYNLSLVSKVGYGMKVVGDEMSIRLCIAQYFFHSNEKQLNESKGLPENIFSEADKKLIEDILYKSIRKFNFRMTDLSYRNLVIHILIALYRIKESTYLSDTDTTVFSLKDCMEWEIAREITDELSKQFDLFIPEGEVGYITIHLLGKKVINSENEMIVHPETLNIVSEMFKSIKSMYDVDFSGDVNLFSMLSLHMQPMLYRAQYGLKMSNPLLTKVKEDYPLAFEMSLIAGTVIWQMLELEIDENELGYLALHFQLAMEKYRPRNKKNVLVVCASGSGTSQILLYRIKKQFEGQLDRVDVISAFRLSEINQNDYDMIMTTIPLQIETKIPVIEVVNLLDENDVNNVKRVMIQSKNAIDLKKYFRKDLFFNHLHLKTGEDVIHFLCERLMEKMDLPDNFERQVFEREKIAPTCLGNYIALPHPAKLMLDEPVFAIAHLDEAINWYGKKQVGFVVLLGGSYRDDEIFNKLNEILYSLIGNRQVMNRLLVDPSYKNFIHCAEELLEVNSQKEEDIFQ